MVFAAAYASCSCGGRRLVLLPAPIFPFTALGMADHLSERRAQREAQSTSSA